MNEPPIEIEPVQSIDLSVGDVMFAVIRSKSAISESDELGFVQITMRRGFWSWIVISGMVSVHVLLLLILVTLANNGSNWPESVITGVALGQAQLLGVWLAMSPWVIWKRLSVVLVILFVTNWIVVNEWNFFATSCMSVCIPSLVFSIPRVLLSWRIDLHPQLPLSFPNWKRGGTMLGIMGYMLACGLGLALARFFESEYGGQARGDEWLTLLSMTLPITLLNASCTVAVMCPKCRAGNAVAVGVIAAFVAMALAIPAFASTSTFLIGIVYAALAGLPIYAGSLFLLRRLGWRLFQQAPRVAGKVDQGSSFDTIETPA